MTRSRSTINTRPAPAAAGAPLLVLTSTYPRRADDTDPGFVHELCRRLALRGFAVTVLAPRAPGLAREEWMDGVRVLRYAYFLNRFETLAYDGGIVPRIRARPWRLLLVPALLAGLVSATRRQLRGDRFAAIHAHWVVPQGLAAVAARRGSRPPILCTMHGGDLFALRSAFMARIRRYCLARCDAVTVVSRFMQQVVEDSGDAPPGGVAVRPMGVDLREDFTLGDEAERADDRVLFVGRLVEKKGVAHLVEAVALLSREAVPVHLDIVADGPLRPHLEALARRLEVEERVRFLGALPHRELPSLLRRATLAVVPSVVDRSGDQEGLGLVTIEAMGCGCPVVASDLPAIRDAVEHEATGLLVPPGDPPALAAAMRRLLADPALRACLASAAREAALERFDWSAVADGYAEILRRLADRDGPAD